MVCLVLHQDHFVLDFRGVQNEDLLRELADMIQTRAGKTKFQHVEGHKGKYGNTQADELAVAGSKITQQKSL